MEAKSVKGKILSGDVIGLDDVVVATENEFNELITSLKTFKLEEPPTVKVIQSNLVVTPQKVSSVFHT